MTLIGKTLIGFEDEQHKQIRLEMEKLGDRILSLEQQPVYANALNQKIARLGFGYSDLSQEEKEVITSNSKSPETD